MVLEGSSKTLCIAGPRDPTATEPDQPLSVWVSPAEAQVSSGLLWGQGLWLQQTWDMQHVAQTLLEEVAISATIEPLRRGPTSCRIIIPKTFWHC